MIVDNYQQTLDYLYQSLPMYQRIGAAAYKNDLNNTLALCKVLGNPERNFKSVHIAGTNGKGSSSHMLAAILQSAGYKTGLYTSPHLKEFTERIRINGAEVEKEFVVDFVGRMKPQLDTLQPSFFEMTVAMAFDYFSRQKVDIAVIEVGLGGRLDSTNVIMPEVCLITNISFDHKDLLGDTLEKIGTEKAGIIKSGIPVVVSERQPETEKVFERKAMEMGSEISFASDFIRLQPSKHGFDVWRDEKLWLSDIHPQLKGSYQRKNITGVLACVNQLRMIGFDIADGAVRKGISEAVSLTGLKGRWQKLSDAPLTVCDTGHNAAGIREVVGQINQTPHRHLHMVFGVVKDKDITEILGLLPSDASYYFCQASIPRAMDAEALSHAAAKAGLIGKAIPDVNEALREATRNADPSDMIFVGGSTFVVAEIEGL